MALTPFYVNFRSTHQANTRSGGSANLAKGVRKLKNTKSVSNS